MAKDGGPSAPTIRALQRWPKPPLAVALSAVALALLLVATSLRLAGPGADSASERAGLGLVPEEVSLALLHFATSPNATQQSKDEIAASLSVLMRRGPSRFLVFGVWYESLMWAAFNYGGRTAFLEESEDWVARMGAEHPELETHKVDYATTLGEAPALLAASRRLRAGPCRARQAIAASTCPLALTPAHGLPRALLAVDWDVIMIDGPRSFQDPAFPGRMSAIFTAAVVARSRSAPGPVDVFLHDVSRPAEREFAAEFLCMDNLVRQVGDLWHFRVWPSSSPDFCPGSSPSS